MTYFDTKVYQDNTNTIAVDKNGAVLSSGPISAHTDNVQIQTAVTAAPPGGIVILTGEFQCAAKITVPKSLTIIGESASIRWDVTSRDLFDVYGSVVSTLNLSIDAVTNSPNIVVSDASSITKGMLVLIYDTAIWNASDYPALKTGETHLVKSVNGNTVYLTDPTANDYLTSRDAKAEVISPVTVNISGVKIYSDINSELDGRGIKVTYGLNTTISDCKIFGIGLRGIELFNCYESLVEKCNIKDCRLSGYGYGVVTSDAVSRVTIQNNTISNCRHNICFSGYATTKGQAKDVRVLNNILDGSEISASLDMHPCVLTAVISGNTITSPAPDVHNTYIGVKRAIITNNIFSGGQGLRARGHIQACDWIVSNNTFTKTNYGFYAGTPGTSWSIVKFIGNVAHSGPLKTIATPSPITSFIEL